MRKYFFLIILVMSMIGYGNTSVPEISDSTGQTTPFRHKRWMVGLSGFITSSNTSFSGANGSADNFSNDFFYNLEGSYFVRDRLAVGIFLGFNRSSSEELIIRETEGFVIGPGLRYYVSKNKEGSLYFQGSPFYTRFYDRSAILNIPASFDNSLLGKGLGVNIGLGYSYVFKDLVILEIGFANNFSWLNGKTTDKITNSITKQNFTQFELSFNFGLSILLGKGIKE
jgi:hypothetical protein